MGLTKVQKDHIESLEIQRDMARALRWPSYDVPRPLTAAQIKAMPRDVEGLLYGASGVSGWFFNTYSKNVSHGWSTGHTHNSVGDKNAMQHCGRMYATQADAWRAMRHDMTTIVARDLAFVDAKIKLLEAGE